MGVGLNIPPFVGSRSQQNPFEVIATQEITSERIHVERAINKIKNYISQTPFEIYETTNGRNSPVSASNHFLSHRRGRSPIKAKGAWVYPQGPGT